MAQNNCIELIHLNSVDSTNNEAKRLIAAGRKDAFLTVANEQTNGRGRQGKSFYSPKDTGIYMSLAYRPAGEIRDSVYITAAAAVCVCKAIERLTDKLPEIKWVNDVYVDNKKICGILTEAMSDPQGNYWVIVGIGINVSTVSFPADAENAGSLNVKIDKAALVDEITGCLLSAIAADNGFGFINYYRSHSLVLGKKIKTLQNEQTELAKAVAIDDNCALIVETEDGKLKTLRSGEISLRITED